jgi:Response regulator receiver domain
MARVSRIKLSLIFLVTGLWCLHLSGATGATNGFETPPPQVGSIKWQTIQSTAKQRQELYRKRVTIPGAVTGNVTVANDALFAKHPEVAVASQTPAISSGTLFKLFSIVVTFVFFGVLILWGFAPHVLADFNQRFNPWVPVPDTEWPPSTKVRAEEESFTRFLTAFRVGPVAPPHTDSPGKEDLVKEFYARAQKRLALQRKLLQDIGREPNGPDRQKMLTDLYLEMGALKNEAGFPEVLSVWRVAFALEGLVQQFMRKMRSITPSTLRTVAGGLDLLENLCKPELKPERLTNRPFKFLIVDDDIIGRQALSLALNKAFSQPDIAVDGEEALARVNEQTYDVIFLDVQMPGMDGFEVCTKIHETTLNRSTPVVFVTIVSDFDARA